MATIHPGNTSAKETGHPVWQSISPETIRELLGEDAPAAMLVGASR